MNSLAKEQFEKIKERHKKNFNVWSWIFRVVTMSIALACIIIYLRDNKQINNSTQSHYQADSESKNTEATDKKRPELTIPVFRSKPK